MRRLWTSLALGLSALVVGCSQPTPPAATDDAEQGSTEEGAGKLWVTAERLARHTCPSDTCGIVGQLMFREGVDPLEEKDGWVRVSKVYDASCQGGRSEYVDKGDARCVEANGIIDGKFAEWVRKQDLSAERPSDPAETASVDESLVAGSDDFGRYRASFAKIAAGLIASGRCSAQDFQEQGGFVKSVNQHRDEPVYFVYCGGMTLANKIYVNAETGATVE